MCINIGNNERLFRSFLGLILLIVALAQFVSGSWLVVTYIFAIMFLITGIVGWCGLYSLLGINTNCGVNLVKENTMDAVTKSDIEAAVKTDSEIKEVLKNEETNALMAEKAVVKSAVKKSVKKVSKKKVVKKAAVKKVVKKAVKKSTKKAAKKK